MGESQGCGKTPASWIQDSSPHCCLSKTTLPSWQNARCSRSGGPLCLLQSVSQPGLPAPLRASTVYGGWTEPFPATWGLQSPWNHGVERLELFDGSGHWLWAPVSLWWSWRPPWGRQPLSPTCLRALLFQTLWFDLQQRLTDEEGTNMVRPAPSLPSPVALSLPEPGLDTGSSVSLIPGPPPGAMQPQLLAPRPSQGCFLIKNGLAQSKVISTVTPKHRMQRK